MTPDDLANLRALRARADANPSPLGTQPRSNQGDVIQSAQAGVKLTVSLDRMDMDAELSTYVLIVGGFHPFARPSDEACQAIANAIWAGKLEDEWQEPTMLGQSDHLRWFIRVRKRQCACPHCQHVNPRTTDAQTMACAKCGQNFEI